MRACVPDLFAPVLSARESGVNPFVHLYANDEFASVGAVTVDGSIVPNPIGVGVVVILHVPFTVAETAIVAGTLPACAALAKNNPDTAVAIRSFFTMFPLRQF